MKWQPLCFVALFGSLFAASAGGPVDPGSAAIEPHDASGSPPDTLPAIPDSPLLALGHKISTTPHFLILDAGGHDSAQPELPATLEESYASFLEVFTDLGFPVERPAERLLWLCFDGRKSYERACTPGSGLDLFWLDSHYATRSNCVVLVDSPEQHEAGLDRRRVAHEAAHQLAFNTGLMTRGVCYPFWISEGLATNFEPAETGERFELPANPERAIGLTRIAEAGRLLPIDELLTLTEIGPQQAPLVGEIYDQAWGFFRFMLDRDPEALGNYLEALRPSPVGPCPPAVLHQGFVDAFGDPAALLQDWEYFAREAADEASAPEPVAFSPSETDSTAGRASSASAG